MVGKKLILLANSDAQLAEFLRFCTVGAICTVIDWIVFSLMCFIAPYQIAVIAGFVISFGVNFILTLHWTFKKAPSKRNFVGLACVHLINLFIVRISVLTLLIEVAAIQERIAYIPTLIISAITSYVMVRFIFKKNDTVKL